MERVKFITHKWRQILLVDFSHCSVDEALQTMDEAKEIIRSQPEFSLLVLTDVTNGRYNLEVIEKLKEFTAGNKPFVRASAVVGVDAFKKVIYNTVVMFTKRTFSVFDDIEEAKEWLIEQ